MQRETNGSDDISCCYPFYMVISSHEDKKVLSHKKDGCKTPIAMSSISIKNISYEKMEFSLFYFHLNLK